MHGRSLIHDIVNIFPDMVGWASEKRLVRKELPDHAKDHPQCGPANVSEAVLWKYQPVQRYLQVWVTMDYRHPS